MRLCLAVTSWFHKPCRQLDDRFFVMDSCFAHTLKKYKWSTCWRKCWILFSIKQKHTSDFEHRFKWALFLCKDNPCTWQVQDVQFYHTSDLFVFFFKSELLTVNDQSCFCFRKVVGFSHFVGYAGDVAFQPKAWKTQIHHLPLQAITSLNCGADNLFKNDVVYVATQDTQKTLWNQIWVARASGLRHRSLCRDPIPIPDLNCILNCLQDWFGSDVQKQNKQKNNK